MLKIFYLVSAGLLVLNIITFLLLYLPMISQPTEKSPQLPPLINQPITNQPKSKIDFSCQMDEDCQIKNVGNQCGYYPLCVNKNFQPNPPELDSIVCGFPSINKCRCVDNVCTGLFQEEIVK